jgi:hypothetical protein
VSGALRDVILQLGIQGVEPDGDRTSFTVVQLTNLQATIPSTPGARAGAVPAHNPFIVAGTAGNHFDEDFALNLPMVLLENCVDAAHPVALAVTVAPAGVPISWSALRDIRPSPNGDDPSVVTLSPHPVPTAAPLAATTGTLLADAVGSFHLRAFVNNNSTADFDRDPAAAVSFSPDPFILMNVVIVRATLQHDDVQTHVGPGLVFIPGAVRGNGPFNVNAPAGDGIHLNGLIKLVSGGRGANAGRLGLNRVFAGWINNMVADLDWRANYLDATIGPPLGPVAHRTEMHFDNPPPALRVPPAGPVVPLAVPPDILDTGHDAAVDAINGGTGGESACLRTNTQRAPTNLAVGLTQRIEAVDSPAPGFTLAHQGTPAAVIQSVHDRLAFTAFLCLWTSNGPAPAPSSMPVNAPGERLYTCVLEVPWRSSGDFNINVGAGTITPTGAAPATNSGPNVPHNPAVAAGTTAIDVRPPAALRIIVTDATH